MRYEIGEMRYEMGEMRDVFVFFNGFAIFDWKFI
jgi:hypothetical protein